MNISYNVTLADLVAFNLYHARHSPAMRRQLMFGRIATSIITAGLMLAILSLLPRDTSSLEGSAFIIAFAAGVSIFLAHPWLMRRSIKGMAEKLAREGKNVGMLGPQRLELQPDGILNESDSGSSTYKWAAVERIAEEDHYAFIYVSAVSAFIIPVAAFDDRANYDAFVRAARDHKSAA